MNELSALLAGSERYGACADEMNAPGEVTQKQLDELSIAVTAKEEA